MRIGIVGSEQAKFTAVTEAAARKLIRTILRNSLASSVVSGACHLGGVDIFAVEEGRSLGLDVQEFPPRIHTWEGGYKQRNIKIAENSDEVYCITVDAFPPDYAGKRFPYCYHCKTDTHIKSGGCWTVKYATRQKKPTGIFVVTAEGHVRVDD